MPRTAATTASAKDLENRQAEAANLQYTAKIHSLPMNGSTKATASVNINGGFAVRSVRIEESGQDLVVTLPGQKLGENYPAHCAPSTPESQAAFEKAVFDAYQQALTQETKGQEQHEPEKLPLEYKVNILSLRPGSGPVKATASVDLGGEFNIRKVSIMESSNGMFVSMPGFKGFKGYQDYCFPCTKESFAEFKTAVLDAYQQALTQGQEAGQKLASGQQMEAPDPFAEQAHNNTPIMQM